MHRRNRHIAFSAKNAGAVLVLDARTIKGISNGGSITNWRDLSTASRNFSWNPITSAVVYKTNIQGGQPVASFAGSAMTVSWLTSENASRYVWIGTEIPRTINANRHLVSTDDGSFNNINFSFAHTTTNLVGTNVRAAGVVTDFYPATVAVNTPYVQSLGYDGSQFFFYRGNFSSATGRTIATNTTRITLGGRLAGSDTDTSDLMQFLLFNSFISRTLRRRFEVASFYTFKIQDTQNTANR